MGRNKLIQMDYYQFRSKYQFRHNEMAQNCDHGQILNCHDNGFNSKSLELFYKACTWRNYYCFQIRGHVRHAFMLPHTKKSQRFVGGIHSLKINIFAKDRCPDGTWAAPPCVQDSVFLRLHHGAFI